MKQSHLLLLLILMFIVISCKKETSFEPPTTTPPVITTPKDRFLPATVSISFSSGSWRDSIRFAYNNKNQLTDVYFNEGQPVTYYGHTVYFYDDNGKVIKAKSYHLPDINAPGALSRTDSIKWTSNNQFIDYPISADGNINPQIVFKLNENAQINYYYEAMWVSTESYSYQGKDILKLTKTDKQGKTSEIRYEYGDKSNPFYQLFIQNPLFYTASTYAAMHFSFGEHNTLKLTKEKSYTDFSYKFDAVTGMITEQKETDIYPAAPSAVTTCKFSYIKVQ